MSFEQRKKPNENIEVPRFIGDSVELENKPELAEKWAEDELRNLSVEKYIERIRESGSGHIVTHNTKHEYLGTLLKKGCFTPTLIADGKVNVKANHLVPSSALHFSVDEFYMGQEEIGFIASIEAIIENKAFLSIPLEHIGDKGTNNDMTVSGTVENAEDESNRFHVDSLGVLLIPADTRVYKEGGKYIGKYENWNEDETPTISIEDYIRGLRDAGHSVPTRIYFYKGRSLEEGLRQFLDEHDLLIPPKDKKVTTSAPVSFLYKRGEGQFSHFSPSGEGSYFGVHR